MKRIMLCMCIFTTASILSCAQKPETVASQIRWTGQSSVIIETSGKTIYIDPYQLKNGSKADIILISHSHSDHLSPDDISNIILPDTTVLAPADCAKQIESRYNAKVTVVEPGFKQSVKGVDVEAVPAYNITKTQFHPVANKWVGYILTVEGNRVYHCGDTERIPEMKNISADIILVPLGQTYTMNSVQDAVDTVLDVKAKIAIPFHYGIYEGTAGDAKVFSEALKGKVKVMIKNRE